ncbi:hypothetical protein LCGC14_2477910 [marine sediment metagenome]|uniref:Uncharacterized protein n=1 Tax=marine sediment metagenome TaxID=412755 RepID=A0A0F9DKK1_9ZZZZ
MADVRERNAHPNWLQYDNDRMVIILDSYEDDSSTRSQQCLMSARSAKGGGIM